MPMASATRADGSVFRIRFMPSAPGDYTYSVVYRQGGFDKTYQGAFQRHADGHAPRGPIRVDPQYPWHFIWEGTGEHYFFNGTTAFWLMGWRDERIIAIQHRAPARPEDQSHARAALRRERSPSTASRS